jgi:hypothetical protein
VLQPITGAPRSREFRPLVHPNLWAAKLTFNVFQGTTIVGTLFSDPQVNEGPLIVPAGPIPTPTWAGATSAARTGQSA